jgi:hypothetical protein
VKSGRRPWLSAVSAANLRRALMALAVIGSLLTVPIAATTHALGHLRGDDADPFKQKGEARPACEVCAAYAGLSHALAHEPPAAVPAPPAAPDVRAFAPRPDGARFHLYFERAPPHSPASA